MLIPNYIYLTNNQEKTKIFVNELLSSSQNIQFKLDDTYIVIDNSFDHITIKLICDNELQGIITYDKNE